MRIAQFTDIHIAAGEDCHGFPVRDQFKAALADAKGFAPDLVLITGDLACDCGGSAAYQWIHQQLQQSGLPFQVMPGNHDDPQQMLAEFSCPGNTQETGFWDFKLRVAGRPVLCLDSGAHKLAPAQLTWLAKHLGQLTERCLLFIHHPPLLTGHKFMDHGHELRNHREVWRIITDHQDAIEHVFCGHYHYDTTLPTSVPVTITPSCQMQIAPDDSKPRFEATPFGYRQISWGQDLSHEVRWFEAQGRVALANC